MKFLIVDDSRAMQTIVKRILQQAGYDKLEFVYADNGDQALSCIREQKPDVVLLDWHMPGMSGIEVLETLKGEQSSVTVGMVTTERAPDKMEAARKAGAKFIIHKPFTVEALKEALMPVLAGIDPDDEERPLIMPSRQSLEKVLAALCNTTVRVLSEKPTPLDPGLTPFLLVLLHNNKDKLRAIALLDQNLICALGGAAGNVAQNIVAQALGSSAVPELLKQHTERALRILSAAFHDPISGGDVNVKSAHLIDQNFGKLKTLYEKSVERLDVLIDIRGYGGGRMMIAAEKK